MAIARTSSTSDEPRALDEREIEAFHRDGFVFVPGFLDDSRTREITRWIDALSALPEEPGKHWVYHEDSVVGPPRRLVQRIERFTEVDARFDRSFRTGRLPLAVEALLGEPVVLFKEKINFKMAGGPGFKAHQDAQAGWSVYAQRFVTVLVTIDATTIENGCLEMVRGANTRLIGEEWKPLDPALEERLRFEPFPSRPGDAMFFDALTPHRSGPNRTADARRVLYVTYNPASEGDQRERYYRDKHRSFPPDVERESGKTYVFRV